MVVTPRRAAALFTPRSRRGWLTAVAAAASGLLVACGSSASTSSSAPAASASSSQAQPAVTVTATVTAPASAAPSASGPAGGTGLAACPSASLRITVDDQQASGAAGSVYYPLDFTNTSSSACQLYGYPGVSFVTAAAGSGQQIGAAAQRSPAFAKVAVRLAPGGSAHAWLKVGQALNYPASSCQPVAAHWLRIYPPGETAAAYLGHTFTACSLASAPLLTVLPVRSGSGQANSVP